MQPQWQYRVGTEEERPAQRSSRRKTNPLVRCRSSEIRRNEQKNEKKARHREQCLKRGRKKARNSLRGHLYKTSLDTSDDKRACTRELRPHRVVEPRAAAAGPRSMRRIVFHTDKTASDNDAIKTAIAFFIRWRAAPATKNVPIPATTAEAIQSLILFLCWRFFFELN